MKRSIKAIRAEIKSVDRLREKLIRDYESEVEYFTKLKSDGRLFIEGPSDNETGPRPYDVVGRGRKKTPIDEVIAHWQLGLDALLSGADPEYYEY